MEPIRIKRMSINPDDSLVMELAVSADELETRAASEEIFVRIPIAFARSQVTDYIGDDTDVDVRTSDGRTFNAHTVDSLDLADDNDLTLWIELS